MIAAATYTFFQIFFWPGGGEIGAFLWLLSVVMVALVVQAFLTIRRATMLPDKLHKEVRGLIDAKQYRAALEMTSKDPSLLGGVMHAALAAAPHGYHAMEKALADTAADRTTLLLRSMEWLNLLGNISPMLGLLGTVWGMIRAFFAIVEAGGIPNAAMLAEALGIKLVCTFVGLIVAIPSLAVYGFMRNRIDGYSAEAVNITQRLISGFRPVRKEQEIPI